MRKLLFVFLVACGATAQPGDILRSQYNAKDPYCYPLSEDVWDCFDSGLSYTCAVESGRWQCYVRGYEKR